MHKLLVLLEAEDALVRRWLSMTDTRHDLEAFGGASHAACVQQQTSARLPAARALAERVFAEFIALRAGRRQHVLRTR